MDEKILNSKCPHYLVPDGAFPDGIYLVGWRDGAYTESDTCFFEKFIEKLLSSQKMALREALASESDIPPILRNCGKTEIYDLAFSFDEYRQMWGCAEMPVSEIRNRVQYVSGLGFHKHEGTFFQKIVMYDLVDCARESIHIGIIPESGDILRNSDYVRKLIPENDSIKRSI